MTLIGVADGVATFELATGARMRDADGQLDVSAEQTFAIEIATARPISSRSSLRFVSPTSTSTSEGTATYRSR